MRDWISRMGVRDRLLLVVLVTVSLALITMTIVFNVVLRQGLGSDADKRLQAIVLDTNRTIMISGGQVSLPKQDSDIATLGSQVWVFVGGYTVTAPRVESRIDNAAKSLDGGSARFLDVPSSSGQARLYAVPLMRGKERIGTIVAGLSIASYLRTQTVVLFATIAFAAALLIIVGFAGRWLLNSAFRPVMKMTSEAEAWSIEDLDRRFDQGEPHDEITQLARTLDNLLDGMAASLRREQRFSAEVSHQLRTPVAKIKTEAELALRRPRDLDYYRESMSSVVHSADQMARTVEALLSASQQKGSLARGRADAWRVLADAVTSIGVLADEHEVEVMIVPPSPELRVGVEGDIAVQVIQPVIENACNFAKSKVFLSASRNGTSVVFNVEDDGPGVADDERELIFEPGKRGSAAAGEKVLRGAGLGLPLARRLARAASGDVEALPNQERGACFVVRLPAG